MSEDGVSSPAGTPPASSPVRVFISYAHDSEAHEEAVRDLWVFLRANGIDAQLDRVAAQRRQDWPLWMMDQVRDADHILVIGSAAYKRRAEGRAEPDEGRGVQFEARLIRDAFYRDQRALDRFVPVLLPGSSVADVPAVSKPFVGYKWRWMEFTPVESFNRIDILLGVTRAIREFEGKSAPGWLLWKAVRDRSRKRAFQQRPVRPGIPQRSDDQASYHATSLGLFHPDGAQGSRDQIRINRLDLQSAQLWKRVHFEPALRP